MADRLRARVLDEQRGNLYLGSTAPDIRVLTRWDRERTHFFDLHNFDEQSGVARALPTPTQRSLTPRRSTRGHVAFIAGYLSHLVMDERWITDGLPPVLRRALAARRYTPRERHRPRAPVLARRRPAAMTAT